METLTPSPDFQRPDLRDQATVPPPDPREQPTELPATQVASTDARRPTPYPAVPGYEILGELGRGGMGVVYRARQISLKRVVALKMILAGAHAGPETLGRFKAEAEAVAKLQHPNIVQVYEVGEHDGLPYFSLEYVAGGSLAQKLRGEPQPAQDAARLVATLAEAMHHAHQMGIVHRDLKPANILLAFSRDASASADPALAEASRLNAAVPKITDFGLAKNLEAASAQTASGAVMGTPSYMAPEQADGRVKDSGPRTDVYALGAILYELLTGRPPFRAATMLDTLEQVRAQEPVPLRQLQPKTPRDLETICLKCLEKEPGRRFADTHALGGDLRNFLEGKPIAARPVGFMERGWRWCRRNRAVAALLMAVAVLVVGGLTSLTLLYLHADQQRAAAEREYQRAENNANREKTAAQKAEKMQRAGINLLVAMAFAPGKDADDSERKSYEKSLRDAASTLVSSVNEGSPNNWSFMEAGAYTALGSVYWRLQDFEVAEKQFTRARVIYSAKLPPDDPEVIKSMSNLALCYTELKKVEQASELRAAIFRLQKNKLGPDNPETLESMDAFARSLVQLNKHDEAVPLIDDCVPRLANSAHLSKLIPGLLDHRLRIFQKKRDPAGCLETADLWDRFHPTDKLSLYNSACFRSVCAEVIQESDKTQRGATQAKIQADTAMSWLQKAVTGGFDDLGQIKQDPDLKALRGRDDFQALLTQMAEKSRSGNPR